MCIARKICPSIPMLIRNKYKFRTISKVHECWHFGKFRRLFVAIDNSTNSWGFKGKHRAFKGNSYET